MVLTSFVKSTGSSRNFKRKMTTMAYNTSITSYVDIRGALDRALASEKGVRLRFPDEKAAYTFAGRVHSFRYQDRKENKKIYPEDHPMHGRSAYDPLMVKKESPTVVCVIKLEGVEFEIEDLDHTAHTTPPVT